VAALLLAVLAVAIDTCEEPQDNTAHLIRALRLQNAIVSEDFFGADFARAAVVAAHWFSGRWDPRTFVVPFREVIR